jgi:methylase of polypeptide subunit release factors
MTTVTPTSVPVRSGRPPAPEQRESWTVEPFREGTTDDYARLRAVLSAASFTEESICEQYAIDRTADYKTIREGRSATEPLDTTRALLTRLFLDGEPVAWEIVRSVFSDRELAAIDRLGLLHAPQSHPEWCRATVMLYPTQGLWLVSDINGDQEGAAMMPPTDVVYPAITQGTQRFVDLMPRDRCARFVELCSGTGVAALVAARDFAEHAWAVDITARATRFARFNAALNDIANVTAVEGDLWEPLGSETFDCIVAHPPYMPSFETQFVFRDGGEDGEQISRRIVAGLSTHLRPGGTYFCSCLGSDRVDAPMERRIREMIGPAADEFDLVIGQKRTHQPVMYYAMLAKDGKAEWATVARRQAIFERLRIVQLVMSAFLIRRHREGDAARPAVTERRKLHGTAVAADFQWLLDWHTHAGALVAALPMDALRPRAAPRVELRVVHRNDEDGWLTDHCDLSTAVPFSAQIQCPAWFAELLMRCDGDHSAREVFESLKRDELLPADASASEFAGMLVRLAEIGMLEVPQHPLPARSWHESVGD